MVICYWRDDRRGVTICTVAHNVPNEGHNRIESGNMVEK